MRVLFLFLFLSITFCFAAAINDIGALPSWTTLHMLEQDYFFLNGLAGLICGSVFSFLITR